MRQGRETIHTRSPALWLALAVLCVFFQGCSEADKERPEAPASADFGARIRAADQEPQNWLSTGRTYSEQHYSPLKQIDRDNVGKLAPAWFHEFDTDRGQEGTPLVIDGVIYVSTAWNKLYAFDARTGILKWSYDPKVDPAFAVRLCCDVVNRGPAAWNGKIYMGVLDGRLVAVDARTGAEVWSAQTVDPKSNASITGAPRVVKGKVIIGHGGADFGLRGYVAAYDAETGKQVWRFYTVPGDPSKPFESPALAAAAKTWTGEWWKQGGGGSAWDAFAFDPDADLLYIGVGNGFPGMSSVRSPGGGDNLYLSSIVAVRPDTGDYVWHYQTTPAETWDFTATQHMILADLTIGGKPRKVLMQAPKNGFFYVLDRVTGELIAARNYVETRWATHVDLATGRPVEVPLYREKPSLNMPGANGGHNWQPMAFSPRTGLVYVPTQELHYPDPAGEGLGGGGPAPGGAADQLSEQGNFPQSGHLTAWDPVAMREVWKVDHEYPSNGGVLATAGGLVFQGTATGLFAAYDAATGKRLWRFDAGGGIMAAPISYAVGGEQYVAVLMGYGGGAGIAHGFAVPRRPRLPGRLLVFRLNGGTHVEPQTWSALEPLDLRGVESKGSAARGRPLYAANCMRCHGPDVIGGILPDLRYTPMLLHADSWRSVVIDGVLTDGGMVGFATTLSPGDAEDIRAYILTKAALVEKR